MKKKYFVGLLGLFTLLPAMVHAGSVIETKTDVKGFVVIATTGDGQMLVDSQMAAKAATATDSLERTHGVSLVEEFEAKETRYQVLGASNEAAVKAYLAALGTSPIKISPVGFTNSPVLGGGPKAGASPKAGHSVYMIEREVPGIAALPLEKMTSISKSSQAVIEKLGGEVEWDHSYLTDEGTFCAYRATDASKVMEHAKIAGIPANKVTEVKHTVYNYDYN